MNTLPPASSGQLPKGLVLEQQPAFVPRMVMTDELRVVVREVIRQWQHRERFAGLAKFGIRPVDRLLFYGPPGNGKTMACQWICGQLGVPLYRVRCDQLVGTVMGDMNRSLVAVCDYLQALSAPALCLFDEIEAIFIDRRVSGGQCDRERSTALTCFFQALDRWSGPALIVMATNLAEQLDAALLSRVELQLEFAGPTKEQALEVIEYWRELLCEYGADDWGPRVAERIENGAGPQSFRELQQWISRLARDWVAGGIEG